jgi:hypothetical protein
MAVVATRPPPTPPPKLNAVLTVGSTAPSRSSRSPSSKTSVLSLPSGGVIPGGSSARGDAISTSGCARAVVATAAAVAPRRPPLDGSRRAARAPPDCWPQLRDKPPCRTSSAATRWTCRQRLRLGASTNSRGPPTARGCDASSAMGAAVALSRCSSGARYATVLPLPVSAAMSSGGSRGAAVAAAAPPAPDSPPSSSAGMASSCIWLGVLMPWRDSAPHSSGARPSAAKLLGPDEDE